MQFRTIDPTQRLLLSTYLLLVPFFGHEGKGHGVWRRRGCLRRRFVTSHRGISLAAAHWKGDVEYGFSLKLAGV